ncbi:MAG: AAA family ATPase, partial [Planctomycetaceae bacterium]
MLKQNVTAQPASKADSSTDADWSRLRLEVDRLPPGCWLEQRGMHDYSDRKIPRQNNPFAPVHPENHGWVWPGKIRAGDLVVVVGDAGTGKSTVMTDWIARVTTGTPFPGCGADQALPPADVLLFNSREDFTRKVIPGIASVGGDVHRVFRASQKALINPAPHPAPAQFTWSNFETGQLHLYRDEGMLAAFGKFLRKRPTIRLVVIDQASLHLRCDSERQFDVVIRELTRAAQDNEVAIVITMQPDAFRNGTGAARYLQSRSLLEHAHSVWHLATPTDPDIPGRVLEIIKTGHGVADEGLHAWHLEQAPDQRLQWNVAEGTELAPTRELLKHRTLVRVLKYVDQFLMLLGGIAGWNQLAERAANHGITPGLLRAALTYGNLPSLFEPHEGDLREIVGYPELIEIREAAQRTQQAAARAALISGHPPADRAASAPATPPAAPAARPPPPPRPAAPLHDRPRGAARRAGAGAAAPPGVGPAAAPRRPRAC